MALDDILTALQTVRAKLNASVQGKGVAVPDESHLYTINKGITMIPVGGSAKYYKCATVDTTAKTWTGYELILTDGKYTVSSDVTTGLTYTTMTPTVNYIYSEDALIRVDLYYDGIPTDGLVFYASLNGDTPNVAETGQALTISGTPVYEEVDAIPCTYFNGSSYFHTSNTTGIPTGNNTRTVSVWIRIDSSLTLSAAAHTISFGNNAANQRFGMNFRGGDLFESWGYSNTVEFPFIYETMCWYHVVLVFENDTDKLYIDGSLIGEESHTGLNIGSNSLAIGVGADLFDDPMKGHLAACRIYNRALTQEEITALANEFTPTTA